MENKKLNEALDGSRKKAELNEDELNKVSGGSSLSETVIVTDSEYLNKYVYIPMMKECGQIYEVRKYNDFLRTYYEYAIRLNKGGEVTLNLASTFQVLPDGVIDVQYSPDGNGGSFTC